MSDITAMIRAAADSIDPQPITAWLMLVVAVIAIISGVGAFIAFAWKFIALPSVRDEFDRSIERQTKAHKLAHDDIDARIRAEAKARADADRRLHDRIDLIIRPGN